MDLWLVIDSLKLPGSPCQITQCPLSSAAAICQNSSRELRGPRAITCGSKSVKKKGDQNLCKSIRKSSSKHGNTRHSSSKHCKIPLDLHIFAIPVQPPCWDPKTAAAWLSCSRHISTLVLTSRAAPFSESLGRASAPAQSSINRCQSRGFSCRARCIHCNMTVEKTSWPSVKTPALRTILQHFGQDLPTAPVPVQPTEANHFRPSPWTGLPSEPSPADNLWCSTCSFATINPWRKT